MANMPSAGNTTTSSPIFPSSEPIPAACGRALPSVQPQATCSSRSELMRRTYITAGGVLLAALVCAAVLPRFTSAEDRKADAKESGKSPSAAQLPIGQVVLFSSGVGYFQREGTVEGSQRIDLTFPAQDINDLIKSLTLRDLDGGHVSAVSYDSNVPVERTLQSFAVNLTGNPGFGAILTQARGEKVEGVLQQSNATQPGTLSGSVVGVEKKQQQVGKDVVE